MNVSSYSDVLRAKETIDLLTSLMEIKNLTVVPYAAIDEYGLRECIRLECERAGAPKGFYVRWVGDIVASIDVDQSGCKHVPEKVKFYKHAKMWNF